MTVLLALLAGAALGLLLDHLEVPGGLIVGAMVGAAGVTLLRDAGVGLVLPTPVVKASYVVIGVAIGLTVTRGFVAQLQAVAAGAVLSAVLIVVAGLLVAVVLRQFGLAPDGAVLATSPGALSVMAAAGAEQGVGAPVAVFHTVRLVVVLLSLPLLVRLAGTG